MQLAYKKFGSGLPLIILHGLYGSGDNWYSIGKKLSESFEVYPVDQRNHGKFPHSSEHTYQSMQQDLLEFFLFHKLEKAIIMGHSMGGKTAMLFSLSHPEKIEKLIIVDIAPKAYKSLQEYQFLAIQHLNIMQAFKSIDLATIQSRYEIEKEFSKFVPDIETCRFLLKNLKREKNNSFRWIINLEALNNFLPQMLDGIDIDKIRYDKSLITFPTLFIKGENSNYILEEDMTNIKDLFPNAEFVTIFNSGHMVHTEQPRQFVNSLRYFLEIM